jgi:hydroxyethylthiazole kinase-like uncharacterized protein yjeF
MPQSLPSDWSDQSEFQSPSADTPEEVSGLPVVMAAEMAAVDQAVFDVCGLDLLQVMELAGWSVAEFVRERWLDGDPRGKHVVVLAGTGGNGGDAMVAARYLFGWGARITLVVSARPEAGRGAAAHQLAVLERIGIESFTFGPDSELPPAELIVDGLLGFGSSGAPRGAIARLINQANAHGAPVVAIDLPSGLDATTGEVYDPCVHASATITLALPKSGLLDPGARQVVGVLTVADIGVPALAYEKAGVEWTPAFATSRFVDL